MEYAGWGLVKLSVVVMVIAAICSQGERVERDGMSGTAVLFSGALLVCVIGLLMACLAKLGYL